MHIEDILLNFRNASDIVLVGGTGFIGRHLCIALDAAGIPATVLSRNPDSDFLRQHTPNIKAKSLGKLESSDIKDIFQAKIIIYLASTSVPSQNMAEPWLEIDSNIRPAVEMFSRAAQSKHDTKIIFISSGGTVYGRDYNFPTSENSLLKPISAYGYGKVAIEEAIRFLGRQYKLRYNILRISNPVGKWQNNREQGIINIAIRASISGETLNLFDGGSQVRDFVDADDVAEAILLLIGNSDYSNTTWNLGSGVPTKISDVVNLVERFSGRTINKRILSARNTDVEYSVLDCTKIREDLGWTAKTSIECMVKKLVTKKTII